MKAIILAAGMGTRLGLKSIPKCLLEIKGETILKRQVNILHSVGVEDVWVVIGRGAECWTEENIEAVAQIVGDRAHVVVNPVSAITQSTHSLYLALQESGEEDSLLILDGDLVFEPVVIQAVLDLGKTAIVTQQTKARGSRVLMKKVDGDFVASEIGEHVISDDVYTGVMYLDKKDVPSLFGKLERLGSKILAFALNELCQENPVSCIRLVTEDGLLEIKSMTGGGFSKTTKMIKGGRQIVRKEAVSPGEQKLKEEINWIQGLPEEVSRHFPKIIGFNINKEATYFEMPYYDLPTLRTLLLSGTIDAQKALEILRKIFDFMFPHIYSRDVCVAPENFVRETHFKKTYERLQEIQFNAPILRHLVNAPSLIINGEKYMNVLNIVQILNQNKDFIRWVSPQRVSMIHGDLHFDNMLIDLEADNFILVDPRGYHTSDIAYDLGKIWHSCHGLYDFIHTRRFNLKVSDESIDYEIYDEPSRKEYDEIMAQLPTVLTSYIKDDENWLIRTRFSEAMHFCSVVPFQLGRDEQESVATTCYAVGVQLLNQVYNEWLALERTMQGKVININTPEDLDRARRIW